MRSHIRKGVQRKHLKRYSQAQRLELGEFSRGAPGSGPLEDLGERVDPSSLGPALTTEDRLESGAVFPRLFIGKSTRPENFVRLS
jgi:hypothetical protein